MGILTVEQIVSADGYAADASGGIDFFTAVDEPAATDAEQLEWLTGVDAILLGGNTYRMFAGYWPGADPAVEPVAEVIARLPKYVFSNAIDHAPWGDDALEVLHGDVATSIAELKGRHASIVVWGSLMLCDELFRSGLVDDLRLRVVPVLIGAGRPFTPADLGEQRLALDHAVSHPSGHVGLHYRLR
jgi:dihydrofolate reductase